MKRLFISGSALLLALISSYSLLHEPNVLPEVPRPAAEIAPPEEKSSLGTKEDPQARLNYELRMLQNPQTGKLPANIRERELAFAARLPQQANARTAQADEWVSAGPFNVGGRTRALAIDRTNEDILLAAGVSGGMWRSVNGGQSWDKATAPQQLHSVTCLTQDPRPGKEHVWYYGTGEIVGNSARGGNAPYRGDGIYKSTDNGQSWQLLPATASQSPEAFDSPFDYIFRVEVNPQALLLDEVYAAAAGGIYRSTDGGGSWERTLADDAAYFTDLVIAPNGTFYATLSTAKFQERDEYISGVFRSTDGRSWQNITPAGWPPQFNRVVIGLNPQNPNEAWFLGDRDDEDPFLWRYTNGGWIELSDNIPDFGGTVGELDLQNSYNMLLKVHPAETQTVFLGGTNLYRSSDGFASTDNTAWIGGYDTTNTAARYPGHHPDQHALVFYGSNPAKAISGHDGGLSLSQNILAEGVDWQSLNNGFRTSQFYTVGLDETQAGSNLIIGGLQDNGSQLTVAGMGEDTRWGRILSGDGGYTHVAYKGAYIYMSFQESQIYRLTLNDDFELTSFARIDPPGAGQVEGQEYLFINPYVFDPNNPNRLYLAAGDIVYRNRNVSQIPAGSQQPSPVNWEQIALTRIPAGSISAISVSDEPSDILYYGTTNGRVFRLEQANDREPPAPRELSHSEFPDSGYVSHIAVNPFDAEEIVVVFSNYEVRSIFHSTDGGRSFSDISGNLEENFDGSGSGPSVRYVALIPLEDGSKLLLAGTSTGLYSTRNLQGARTEWTQEAPEYIGRVVVPQIRHRSLDGRVVIATHGNGVYYRDYGNVRPNNNELEGGELALLNAFPNPFSEETIIGYTLPAEGTVRIRIYDQLGRRIKTLLYNRQFPGNSEISWDGTNATGVPVPPGVYFIRMEYGQEILTKRVVRL